MILAASNSDSLQPQIRALLCTCLHLSADSNVSLQGQEQSGQTAK